jgi:hypothetical protein
MRRGHQRNKRLIFAIYASIFVSPAMAGSKGKRESSIVKRQFGQRSGQKVSTRVRCKDEG